MDIRKPIDEIINNTEEIDILFVNVPSRWISPKKGLFDLPYEYLENFANNSTRLYGDQDYEPNHGLLSVISYLRDNGIKVGLLDIHTLNWLNYTKICNYNANSVLIQTLLNQRPKIIAFSSMTPSLENAKLLAKTIKLNYNNNATIILGGMATCEITDCLNDGCFDILVVGEGEYTTLELVQCLLKDSDYSNIKGIAYKKDDYIIKTETKAVKGQTKSKTAYDLLPKELDLIPRIFTSRGCANGCPFCSPSIFFNNQIKIRPANEVIKEINYIHSNFDFRWFLIGDLTFPINNSNSKEILTTFTNMDIKPWWCQTQVSQLNKTSINLLKRAGCYQIALGFEDFSINTISLRRKNPNIIHAMDVCESLKTNSICIQGYWIFGLPEENLQSSLTKIENMCSFIRKRLMDTIHISFLIPYPNLKLENVFIDQTNFNKYIDLSASFYNEVPMHHTTNLSAKEIFLLVQLAISCCANEFSRL